MRCITAAEYKKKEINGLKVKVIGFNGKERGSEHVRWRESKSVSVCISEREIQ